MIDLKLSTHKFILFVDDNKAEQKLFTELLKEIDKNSFYSLADNGKDALDYLLSQNGIIDLIILDINMPVMDGIEFLKRRKDIDAIYNIPVIVYTSDESCISEVKKLGANGLILKQPNMQNLQKQLDEVLKKNYKYPIEDMIGLS